MHICLLSREDKCNSTANICVYRFLLSLCIVTLKNVVSLTQAKRKEQNVEFYWCRIRGHICFLIYYSKKTFKYFAING